MGAQKSVLGIQRIFFIIIINISLTLLVSCDLVLIGGKTSKAPMSFSLMSPANEIAISAASANTYNLSFSWSPSVDSTEYMLEISADPGFPERRAPTMRAPSQAGIRATTYSASATLEAGKRYYWRVTAFNAYGMFTTDTRWFETQ